MADESNPTPFRGFAAAQKAPGTIADEDIYTFEGFDGLNTKPSRLAILDQQMYWCDNFQPLGTSNLIAMKGIGTALYTATGGKTISSFYFFTLGANSANATHYVAIFLSDGSLEIYDADNVGAGLKGSLPASTFTAAVVLPGARPSCAQFGRQYLLIVNDQTNGYWVWNGSAFFTSGGLGPDVSITQSGFNYTSTPTISAFGGSGSSATFTSTISAKGVATISVTNPGSGYAIGDIVGLAFTGGGGNTTARATVTITNGTVTGLAVAAGGTGYNSASTKVTFVGGGGSGATATATVAAGVVTGFTITAAGSGYISAPTALISDPANNVAVAYVTIMPTGISGTSVEVFNSRVWIGNDAKVFLSAAGSVSDFSLADGAGVFSSTDSFLREHYTLLKQAKGLLFLFADSSINYVSGINTTVYGSIATTSFSNQNQDPQVGTSWPNSVQAFGGGDIGTLIFANSYGVHAVYGGQTKKISDPLDGIYATVTQNAGNSGFGSFFPSAACAQINGVNVYVLLYPIVDPISGLQRNALLCWNGKRWFTASQEVPLTFISTKEQDSSIVAWGTDGLAIYPLFQQASSTLVKTVQSKLWSRPSYIVEKKANRFWAIFESTSNSTISFGIDNQAVSTSVSSLTLPYAFWTTTLGPAYWTSTSGSAYWSSAVQQQLYLSDIDTSGYVLGFTIQTTAPDFTLISVSMGYQQMTQYI